MFFGLSELGVLMVVWTEFDKRQWALEVKLETLLIQTFIVRRLRQNLFLIGTSLAQIVQFGKD